MAGKGRRTASRHAQLKRKKTIKGPSGIPAAARRMASPEVQEPVAVPAGVEDAGVEGPEAAAAAPAPRATRPSPVARTPSGNSAGQTRLRGERPAAYLYVGAELRRILLLTAAIFAALIVLGILL